MGTGRGILVGVVSRCAKPQQTRFDQEAKAFALLQLCAPLPHFVASPHPSPCCCPHPSHLSLLSASLFQAESSGAHDA